MQKPIKVGTVLHYGDDRLTITEVYDEAVVLKDATGRLHKKARSLGQEYYIDDEGEAAKPAPDTVETLRAALNALTARVEALEKGRIL
jgi:ubiquinone biosynthesis protein UbiJ